MGAGREFLGVITGNRTARVKGRDVEELYLGPIDFKRYLKAINITQPLVLDGDDDGDVVAFFRVAWIETEFGHFQVRLWPWCHVDAHHGGVHHGSLVPGAYPQCYVIAILGGVFFHVNRVPYLGMFSWLKCCICPVETLGTEIACLVDSGLELVTVLCVTKVSYYKFKADIFIIL